MSKPHTDLIVVCNHRDMVGVLTKTDIVGQISRGMGSGCTARGDSIMTPTSPIARHLLHDTRGAARCLVGDEGTRSATCSDPRRGSRPLGIIYAREALQALLSESENKDELLRDYISGVG